MNNEPVAWMGKDYDGIKTDLYFDVERRKLPYRTYETAIPLYTHPTKTLTDEEIEKVYRNVEQDFALTESKKPDGGWRNFPVELGRAILRKAQEK